MQLVELAMKTTDEVGNKIKMLELLEHYKKLDKDFWTYLEWEKSSAYQKGLLEAMRKFNEITKESK